MNIKALNGLVPTVAQSDDFKDWHICAVIDPLFDGYALDDIEEAYDATITLAESHGGLVDAMKLWLMANCIDESDNGVVLGVHYGGVN